MRPAPFAALATIAIALALPVTGQAQALPHGAACVDTSASADPSRAVACAEQAVERAQRELSRAYRSVWVDVPAADRAAFARSERAWLDGRYAEARRCAERETGRAAQEANVDVAASACLARMMEARRDALLAASPAGAAARTVSFGAMRAQ